MRKKAPSTLFIGSLLLFLPPFLMRSQANDNSGSVPPAPPAKTSIEKKSPAALAKDANGEEGYRIGPGDVLHISVWKEPDASIASIVVRPDGKITLPLLKEVNVGGLTTSEAEDIIARGLNGFIADPNVTVIVTAINSKKVYVIGAVKKEGPLSYTYRMSIMQALTEAGGLTDYAKRKKIYVLRAQNGKEERLPFNYDSVLNGKTMEHIWLMPNDTLVVPH